MIYATAGHVDHGKTSLVKAITNVDTDRLAEEKARGLTIDLGFAYFEEGDSRIGFVDVPGHAKFISNMLAGVSTIDHALIVIAADDGPMPQTIEHIAILQTLGIKDATIALTKVDRVSLETLEQSKTAIKNLLDTTPFKDARIFPTSTQSLEGIGELKTHLLGQKRVRASSKEEHFRLAIDRKFTIKGAGIVVTGSIFSGQVETGSEVYLMPHGKKVRVRGLHRQDSVANVASVGDRCALNLSGNLDQEDIERGHWITSNPELPTSSKVDCELHLLDFETSALKTGTPIHFHVGAQHGTGRVFLLERRQLKPGERALVQVALNEPISACIGDRFVIRDQSATRTLGGGQILDPYSVKRGRSRPDRLKLLEFLASTSNPGELTELLKTASNGINLIRYSQGLNKPLVVDRIAQDDDGLHHYQDHLDALKQRILNYVEQKPLSISQLLEQTSVRKSFLALSLRQLVNEKKIEMSGNSYGLANTATKLSKPAETLWSKVKPILDKEPMQPPVITELAKSIGLPQGALDKLLGECIKQGLLVKPVKNRYFLAESMSELRQLAIKVAEQHGGQFTVIQFRDSSGLGRNLCIELLEHLDGKGFTKRLGDQRIIQDSKR